MNNELKDLHDRMRNIILNTCNKIGCGNCGLEWNEEGESKCSATELQSKIMDLEINEKNNRGEK